MPNAVLVDLALAAVPFLLMAAITWRLVWPRWKFVGKAGFYFVFVGALSFWIGHWSVLAGVLHQAFGLAVHIWFSRKHGFTWWRVEEPERYVALSKAMVGVPPEGEGTGEDTAETSGSQSA